MKKRYEVMLEDSERKYIHEKINDPVVNKTMKKRAQVLLMLDKSCGTSLSQQEISKRCLVSNVTVWKVEKQYCEQGLKETLTFHKNSKPSRAPKIVGEIEAPLIALACSEPPEGFSRWSLRLLAKKMVELKIIDSVCPDTVRLALKKHNLNHT